MKHDLLDSLLAAYAKQPLPTAAEPSVREIWREIERRRAQSVWERMFSVMEFRELFAQPRMAVVALALAMVVGVVPAALVGRAENERRLARQSIHFEVFAAGSGSLGPVFGGPLVTASRLQR
jgi:hypothetical protein